MRSRSSRRSARAAAMTKGGKASNFFLNFFTLIFDFSSWSISLYIFFSSLLFVAR